MRRPRRRTGHRRAGGGPQVHAVPARPARTGPRRAVHGARPGGLRRPWSTLIDALPAVPHLPVLVRALEHRAGSRASAAAPRGPGLRVHGVHQPARGPGRPRGPRRRRLAKIEVHSLDHDVARVLAVVRGERTWWPTPRPSGAPTPEQAFHDRADRLLPSLHEFFERCHGRPERHPRAAPEPGRRPSWASRGVVVGGGLRRLGVAGERPGPRLVPPPQRRRRPHAGGAHRVARRATPSASSLPAGRCPASYARRWDAVLIGGGGILSARGGVFRDVARWIRRARVPVGAGRCQRGGDARGSGRGAAPRRRPLVLSPGSATRARSTPSACRPPRHLRGPGPHLAAPLPGRSPPARGPTGRRGGRGAAPGPRRAALGTGPGGAARAPSVAPPARGGHRPAGASAPAAGGGGARRPRARSRRPAPRSWSAPGTTAWCSRCRWGARWSAWVRHRRSDACSRRRGWATGGCRPTGPTCWGTGSPSSAPTSVRPTPGPGRWPAVCSPTPSAPGRTATSALEADVRPLDGRSAWRRLLP